MDIKILAFLQNCWFPRDTRLDYIHRYLSDDVFRRRVLSRGWTGHRLINAFGEKMYSEIIWENASIEVGDHSSHCGEPDLEHVRCMIEKHNPDLILTFGRVAFGSVNLVNNGKIPVMSTKHPSARGFKNNLLQHFVKNVKAFIQLREEKEECEHI